MLVVQPVAAQQAGASIASESKSELTAELFYQLLLGELNAIGGEPGVGFSIILDAARKTGDERLFKRATEIALRGRSGHSALQAARAWRTAMPSRAEANGTCSDNDRLNRLRDAGSLKRELTRIAGRARGCHQQRSELFRASRRPGRGGYDRGTGHGGSAGRCHAGARCLDHHRPHARSGKRHIGRARCCAAGSGAGARCGWPGHPGVGAVRVRIQRSGIGRSALSGQSAAL